ncbi:MAG: hypothetical protein P8J20_19490, partial [Novosphingobium sp.]|nr:hypothetical protein [Novosphingobium sp.]
MQEPENSRFSPPRLRAYWPSEKTGSTLLGAFNNLLTDGAANETAADFVRKKIREIVKDIGIA